MIATWCGDLARGPSVARLERSPQRPSGRARSRVCCRGCVARDEGVVDNPQLPRRVDCANLCWAERKRTRAKVRMRRRPGRGALRRACCESCLGPHNGLGALQSGVPKGTVRGPNMAVLKATQFLSIASAAPGCGAITPEQRSRCRGLGRRGRTTERAIMQHSAVFAGKR